ncbi:hypothetical protein CesoFtcFv8_022743 [Champsocephalus esox]|uniref:Pre-mRNA-splicing factor Syf1-like N-terminal HAT-repeats domain-containing protein n=1 Tax=Champsocephalus esox TaxID=159716 RepID=A0AAN8B7D9_9TELE|nr:hypothetical protein CesoFtcFv8_022743 [Champsocephalus esox]
MASTAAGKQRIPKVAKVKNKAPAEVQITAEQLLREAKERELELLPPPPKQKITDEEELNDYKLRKRKGFEDNIRKNRTVISNWIKYAQWEESLKEVQRARSIYERALDVDHRNITLWLKYAEMEMKSRQVNHARNIWDRAITILPPRQPVLVQVHVHGGDAGERGGLQAGVRALDGVGARRAGLALLHQLRAALQGSEKLLDSSALVLVHPEVKNWIKYARFEEKHGYIAHSRKVYERSVDFFGEDYVNEHLFVAFAKFEEAQKEFERVRDVIVSKRRFQYEEEVKANPHNYDAWFDYLRLVENDADPDTVREVYERSIANIPPIQEKRHWKRYIYLWINYALYEELEVKDPERTRQVYQASLDLIPHKKFTFAKIWLLYAQFEMRQKNLQGARKVMGTAIGKCPKNKLLKGYIELELQLREFDRCRKLYEKYLEFTPENCTTWIKFSELETILGDVERARAIFELAIGQPRLDMPEVLWKSYIDFEIEQEEFGNTRNLYKRLLQRTQHVKVWISFAKFELSIDGSDRLQKSRQIFEEANKGMRSCEEKEERLMLLESWSDFEKDFGSDSSMERVQKLLPEKVKKRRKLTAEDGSDAGWEEYYDYIFPEDAANQPNLKLLAMAKMWKRKQVVEEEDEEDEDADKSPEEADKSPEEMEVKSPEESPKEMEVKSPERPPKEAPSSSSSSSDEAADPPEKQPENNDSDRKTEPKKKDEDDRDESSSSESSSSSSESSSSSDDDDDEEEEDGKKETSKDEEKEEIL